MSPDPHQTSSTVMVGDFRDRMRPRLLVCLGTVLVAVAGHELLPQLVDTTTRTGWLIAHSVWALAIVVVVAMAADMVRQRTTRQVFVGVTASGIVLRTGRGPEATMGWESLAGVILQTGHRATTRTDRPWLRMILVPRPGVGLDPQFAQWRGRCGANDSDVGLPVLLYTESSALDIALRQFAGPLYQGIVDTGTTFSAATLF